MQRRLFLAALAAIVVIALVLWMRDGARPAETPDPLRSTSTAAERDTTPLIAPTDRASGAERSEVSTATSPAPTPTAAPTWTGIRVRTVSRETRAPIAGIPVSAHATGSRGAIADIPSTDDNGYVELVLDAGFTGTVHANGLAGVAGWGEHAVDSPLAAGEVRAIEIALPTALDLVLHGRVIDRETNAPIPDARVGTSEGLGQIRADDEQRTDADGRFHVEGATWTPRVVQVIATGYELAGVSVGPGHADAATALEIALSRVASVRITATSADGSPVAGKRVDLSTAGYRFGRPDGFALISSSWPDEARYKETTDAAGRAFFADLPPRMPLAGVIWEGRDALFRAPETISLEPGELREVAWTVGAGCAIHGVALEESGAPAAGLAIALETAGFRQPSHFERHEKEGRRRATTDAEGRFTFSDVGAGNWWVGVAPSPRTNKPPAEDAPAPAAQLVVVDAGVARVDVTIRVARGHVIRGRLLEPDGKAARHAMVTIERTTDRLLVHESVNTQDGTFVLGPLEPGEYVLNAQSMAQFVDALPVTARTGDTDVVLQLRRGGTIAGVVVDAAGKPVPRADVVMNPHITGRWANLSSNAGDDGRFRFDGLAEGLYDMAARTPDGQVGLSTAIEVVAGGAPADVRIETAPGARVRVRYQGAGTHVSVSVLSGGVTIDSDGVEKGTERAFAAPVGACVVRATRYSPKEEFDFPLTLAAGETRDLVFDGAWK